VRSADTRDIRAIQWSGINTEIVLVHDCGYVMYVGASSMCNVEGCYLAGWDVCPACAKKQRRALRKERRKRPEPSGDQEKLFGGTPKMQLNGRS
jgi:hypothetical protein